MRFLITLTALVSTQAFAAPVQYEATITLTNADAVHLLIFVDDQPMNGKVSYLSSRAVTHDDVDRNSHHMCESEAHVSGAKFSVTILDSDKNLLSTNAKQVLLGARRSELFESDVTCVDLLPRNEPMDIGSVSDFYISKFDYKGKAVELALDLHLHGSMIIDTAGNYQSKLNLPATLEANYFINNGEGIDRTGRGPYTRGVIELRDPTRYIENNTNWCDAHPSDC